MFDQCFFRLTKNNPVTLLLQLMHTREENASEVIPSNMGILGGERLWIANVHCFLPLAIFSVSHILMDFACWFQKKEKLDIM